MATLSKPPRARRDHQVNQSLKQQQSMPKKLVKTPRIIHGLWYLIPWLSDGIMATLSSSPTMSNSVSATLSRYLEQRGIVHPSTWQSTDTTLTLPQFALRSLVLDLETSTNDVVQFSYSTQDPTQIEQQYSKFKVSINITLWVLNFHPGIIHWKLVLQVFFGCFFKVLTRVFRG